MITFTIILPTYNRANLLPQAIKSVLSQSFKDWELIVVDDGSTDNTREVVLSFNDSRIKYIYQANSERSAARNNGVTNASGQWICFLDSDDYFLPNHLEVLNSKIKNIGDISVFFNTGCLKKSGEVYFQMPTYNSNLGLHPAHFILESTSITPISVCIHKSLLERNKFLEKFKKAYWEDTHLWIRLACQYPFIQISQYTCVLTQHEARSVNTRLSMERVIDHVFMIKHLFSTHFELIGKVFSKEDEVNYIDRKYRMFLYQLRQNKQFQESILTWAKAIVNRPSWYLMSEFPKIFLNQIGAGFYGKRQA